MLKFFDHRQLRHSPVQELHNGSWVPYAEKASRAEMVAAYLGDLAPATDFGLEPLQRVHSREYIDFLSSAHDHWRSSGRDGDAFGYTWPVVGRRQLQLDRIDAKLGRYSYDASTPIAEGTWEAAYWSAQTALSGLEALLSGAARVAFALCRPPGHHAGADYLGGYCYLNNAAIAAQAALDKGHSRVAILDIDYHHGNGTQDIFLNSPDVLFVSVHADPSTDYPFFWGHSDEQGAGDGEGMTLNLPLPRGTEGPAYRGALKKGLEKISAHAPSLLLVSFGADTFKADPISHFALETEDYPHLAEDIAKLGIPSLIVMEGGYAIDALGENVAAFLEGLEK
jgi:acetoin utilization deacetylase AcuC-like enzyme